MSWIHWRIPKLKARWICCGKGVLFSKHWHLWKKDIIVLSRWSMHSLQINMCNKCYCKIFYRPTVYVQVFATFPKPLPFTKPRIFSQPTKTPKNPGERNLPSHHWHCGKGNNWPRKTSSFKKPVPVTLKVPWSAASTTWTPSPPICGIWKKMGIWWGWTQSVKGNCNIICLFCSSWVAVDFCGFFFAFVV